MTSLDDLAQGAEIVQSSETRGMDEPFADRWNHKWAACGFADIGMPFVSCSNAVLPSEAAPCLSFDRAARPAPLWEIFRIQSPGTATDRQRLAPFLAIGSDGAGNPICVEQGTGAVVVLDHEDHFHTRQFVNSSVRQLAECLLAYMGERDSTRLRTTIQVIDAAAIVERSFWWYEAGRLE